MPQFVDHIDIKKEGMIYYERPGYYFGYGLESVPKVMDAITGRSVTAELGVVVANKLLAVQEIDQVPDMPAEAFGNKSPHQILMDAWSKHTDVPFSSYTLLDAGNRSDLVSGTLYEIHLEDAERLNHFDLATPFTHDSSGQIVYPGWRGPVSVELADGRKAFTLTTYPEQATDRVVSGLDYNPFLNDEAITMRVIQEAMGE